MSLFARAIRTALQPAACHPQLAPAFAGTGLPASASDASFSGGLGLEHAAERIGELLAPLWLAVPKSKTTRSRKRMRAANKHLKNIQHIVECHNCGAPKLRHHVCTNCLVADWNNTTVSDTAVDCRHRVHAHTLPWS